MNALALQDFLEQAGVATRVQSAISHDAGGGAIHPPPQPSVTSRRVASSSSVQEPVFHTSQPIPSLPSARSRSRLMSCSWPRTVSTASIGPTRAPTRRRRRSTRSPTRRRWSKASRSSTPPLSACAWTTACRWSSSGCSRTAMSPAPSVASASARWCPTKLSRATPSIRRARDRRSHGRSQREDGQVR